MSGGNRQPFVAVREATSKGYAEAYEGDSINLEQPNSKTRMGRVGRQVAQTLTTSFEKAEEVNSNTQLYKQAGNSIVVAVPYYIIKQLFESNIFIEKEAKTMELKVNAVAIPEQITFNYEELKAELLQKISIYESMVYTEDQIKNAKKDRAALNALKKALNDERIRREREYMQPFNQFKTQINEIIQIIDKPCAVIDKQIKTFEDQQKQEKLDAITEYWNGCKHPENIHLAQILDQKWLNASVSMKTIQEAMDAKVNQINSDLAVIHDLPAFSLEAEATYLQTLDLGRAVAQSHRLTELAEQQKAKEEAQKAQIQPQEAQEQQAPVGGIQMPSQEENEPERQWIGFQAYLSVAEAKALGAFLKSNGIRYKAI